MRHPGRHHRRSNIERLHAPIIQEGAETREGFMAEAALTSISL